MARTQVVTERGKKGKERRLREKDQETVRDNNERKRKRQGEKHRERNREKEKREIEREIERETERERNREREKQREKRRARTCPGRRSEPWWEGDKASGMLRCSITGASAGSRA